MRRALAPVVLALLLPAAPAQAKSCAEDGTQTVRKNDVARIYEQGEAGSEALKGCLRSRGVERSVWLSQNYDDGIYESEAWSGVRLWRRFVVWDFTRTDSSCKADCPPGYGHWEYRYVRDLSTRKRVSVPMDFRLGRAFVVTTTRALATVVRGELRALVGGEVRVLDTGIEPASLAARGDRVSWTKDGAPQQTRL